MSSPDSPPRSSSRLPLASEVAAFTDAELDQYLDNSRATNGWAEVDVQDPENLPESLMQRLRDRVSGVYNRSRPVDLAEVSARLSSATTNQPRPTTRERGPWDIWSNPSTPNSEERAEQGRQAWVESETRSYESLVKNGGRPSYPVELLPELSSKPREYAEILRYWTTNFEEEWMIFTRQGGNWRVFLWSQEEARKKHKDDMGAWSASVREKLAANPLVRLRRPVEFDLDPKRQDKLTTWIEFIFFECKGIEHEKKKEELERRKLRLRWAIDQMAEIEAEMRQEGELPVVRGTKRDRAGEEDDGDAVDNGSSSNGAELPAKRRKTTRASSSPPPRRSRRAARSPPPPRETAGEGSGTRNNGGENVLPPPLPASSQAAVAAAPPGPLQASSAGARGGRAKAPLAQLTKPGRRKRAFVGPPPPTLDEHSPLRRSQRIAERNLRAQPGGSTR